MDRRRTLLLALAGVAAAPLSGFAQNNPSLAVPTPAPPSKIGAAEQKHVYDTLRLGTMSLELSQMAVGRASGEKVKEFATFEVAEQTTMGGILKPMAGGAAPVDPTQVEMINKLEQAHEKFDSEYVKAEVVVHNKLLQVQDAYLAVGHDPLQVDISKLAQTMIREHLKLLDDLQKGGMRG